MFGVQGIYLKSKQTVFLPACNLRYVPKLMGIWLSESQTESPMRALNDDLPSALSVKGFMVLRFKINFMFGV